MRSLPDEQSVLVRSEETPQPGSLVGQRLAIGAEHGYRCRARLSVQSTAIGAEHGGMGRRGLQTSFQHMAEHRFAIDFSD